MVVLRLKKMGRAHHPFYRLSAMDQRSPRDGRVIEQLGWYEPQGKEGKHFNRKRERVQYGLGVGAQPSPTAATLIARAGGTVSDKVLAKVKVKGRIKTDTIRAKKGLEPMRGPKPKAEEKKA
jgi:small subunit ribosomal protein S16